MKKNKILKLHYMSLLLLVAVLVCSSLWSTVTGAYSLKTEDTEKGYHIDLDTLYPKSADVRTSQRYYDMMTSLNKTGHAVLMFSGPRNYDDAKEFCFLAWTEEGIAALKYPKEHECQSMAEAHETEKEEGADMWYSLYTVNGEKYYNNILVYVKVANDKVGTLGRHAYTKTKQKALDTVMEWLNGSGIKENMTDMQKFECIFNTIMDHVKPGQLTGKNKCTRYGDWIEAVESGKAVCHGYSQLCLIMCKAAGIECQYVHGKTDAKRKTPDHAWNKVVLDGTEYYTDLLWSDHGNPSNSRYKLSTKLFSSREICDLYDDLNTPFPVVSTAS